MSRASYLRDWQRVQESGVYPEVTSPVVYERRVVTGLQTAGVWLREAGVLVPTVNEIRAVHEVAFRKVHPWAGQFRPEGYEVAFGNFVGTPSGEVPDALKKLNRETRAIMSSADSKPKQVVFAAFYHASFEMIHPFQDGNGRVGRAILGAQLDNILQDRKRTILERDEYLSALKEVQRGGDPISLAKLVVRSRFSEKELSRVKSRAHGVGLEL